MSTMHGGMTRVSAPHESYVNRGMGCDMFMRGDALEY